MTLFAVVPRFLVFLDSQKFETLSVQFSSVVRIHKLFRRNMLVAAKFDAMYCVPAFSGLHWIALNCFATDAIYCVPAFSGLHIYCVPAFSGFHWIALDSQI